jgi:DNA-binding LytR/AlgR family response regulator
MIKCVITDDEPLARRGIENYIARIPFLQLEGVCEDAVQLNTFLLQHKVDLLFLDIEMPYVSGIEILKGMKQPPLVIFTTAYERYAVQGFELDVLDYLLKPITFDRFLKAANKAAEYLGKQTGSSNNYLFVKTDGRLEKVIFDEIVAVEALENYVCIYSRDKKFITHITLKSIQEQLPGEFIQTHKSWIVNTAQIKAVDMGFVVCADKRIPLSKQHRDSLMKKIVEGNLLKRN